MWSNQQGAVNIGRMLLYEANRLDWQGTVTVAGEATTEAGNTYPASRIRAGDWMLIEEDDWQSLQPVNSTGYDHSDLLTTVHIGAPPNSGEVLLAQLAAATDLLG